VAPAPWSVNGSRGSRSRSCRSPVRAGPTSPRACVLPDLTSDDRLALGLAIDVNVATVAELETSPASVPLGRRDRRGPRTRGNVPRRGTRSERVKASAPRRWKPSAPTTTGARQTETSP
jgi:hypothetical protein